MHVLPYQEYYFCDKLINLIQKFCTKFGAEHYQLLKQILHGVYSRSNDEADLRSREEEIILGSISDNI